MRRLFTIFGLIFSLLPLWATPQRVGHAPKRTATAASSHIKVSYALNLTPEQLVRQALLGSGVTISNVKFNSSSSVIGKIEGGKQIGTFTADQTLFPEFDFSDGLILTTGYADIAEGPNSEEGATSMVNEEDPYATSYSCPLLEKMEPDGEHNNPSVLEFDFSATFDAVAFRYIFASEEYPEFVGSEFNDMFAFYITDLTTNQTKNIAIIPGTTKTVCINNVNIDSYSQYYHEVPANSYHMQFDAYLSSFTAQSTIVPNRTYHMTLVICHLADYYLDSGVFLEGKSFSSVTSNTGIDACERYFWEGTWYTESGIYQKTYHISETVDSLATLNLRIHHPVTEPVTQTICTNELPYVWRDTIFGSNTSVGTHSYTFYRKTVFGCDSTVTLNLKVLPNYNQQENLTICTNELPYTWRDTVFGSNTSVGTHSYTFLRKTISGCDSIVTLRIKVLPVYNRMETITICPNRLPYTWEDTIFGSDTKTGTYYHKVYRHTVQGCDSTITLELTVEKVTNSDIYDEIFVDSTYNAYNFVLPPHHEPGTYTYVHQDEVSSGCDSATTLHLTVNPEPFNPWILSNPTVCSNDLAFDLPYDYTTTSYAPEIVTIQFDGQATSMGFDDASDLISSDKSITISLPANVRPDLYHGTATFAGEKFKISVPFDLMVRYPASIIAQKWNNLLALRDSSGNGGYIFDRYEWYINDQKIPNQTRSYLYMGEGKTFDFGQDYCAAIRRQGEDYYIFTCPIQPKLRNDVSLFPTVVKAGQSFKYAPARIEDASETNLIESLEVSIYNTDGNVYSHQSLQVQDGEYIIIPAPTSSGAFLVHIASEQSLKETHRLLVIP